MKKPDLSVRKQENVRKQETVLSVRKQETVLSAKKPETVLSVKKPETVLSAKETDPPKKKTETAPSAPVVTPLAKPKHNLVRDGVVALSKSPPRVIERPMILVPGRKINITPWQPRPESTRSNAEKWEFFTKHK